MKERLLQGRNSSEQPSTGHVATLLLLHVCEAVSLFGFSTFAGAGRAAARNESALQARASAPAVAIASSPSLPAAVPACVPAGLLPCCAVLYHGCRAP